MELACSHVNHSVLGNNTLTTTMIIKFDSHENTLFELYAGSTQFESRWIRLLFGLSFMHLHILPAVLLQTKLFFSIFLRTLRTPFIPSTPISISLKKIVLN